MRNFQEVIGGITNNLQAIAKIHGAAYDISVLIVSPNRVIYEGTKRISDDTDVEDRETPIISIEKVEFHYPTKPDVKVLQGVSIDVKQNQIVAIVGSSGKNYFLHNLCRLWQIFYYFTYRTFLWSNLWLGEFSRWKHQKPWQQMVPSKSAGYSAARTHSVLRLSPREHPLWSWLLRYIRWADRGKTYVCMQTSKCSHLYSWQRNVPIRVRY